MKFLSSCSYGFGRIVVLLELPRLKVNLHEHKGDEFWLLYF